MEPNDECALSLLGPELIVGPLIQASQQGALVDVEEEHRIEQMDELRKVPRPSAEEGVWLVAVRSQRLDHLDSPDVVLMHVTGTWCACFGVPLVRQVCVAVDGLIAAALQLRTDRGLTAAGNALDEEVALAHGRTVAPGWLPGGRRYSITENSTFTASSTDV